MMTASSTAGDGNSELSSPEVHETKGGAASIVECDGVEFTVTERNEVAEVARRSGAARVLDSESFFDAGTGTRHHFVDVQGPAEAMVFLVSVHEDQRRIVAVSRCS